MNFMTGCEQLIVRAAHLMNDDDFPGWMQLCASNFEYSITAFSTEIDKKVVWMQESKNGLVNILETLVDHVTDTGHISRHLGPVLIVKNDEICKAESSVTIWHTDRLGTTNLYAVGRYIDEIGQFDEELRFLKRELALKTRRLPTGSHVPL